MDAEHKYRVRIYQDRSGRQPVKELLLDLEERAKNSKDARIQHEKIVAHIRTLRIHGTRIGEPHVKHLEGELWELRPLSHRIIFFYWRDNTFVLLHHFIKKTQKTPDREIERARKNLQDFLERSGG